MVKLSLNKKNYDGRQRNKLINENYINNRYKINSSN